MKLARFIHANMESLLQDWDQAVLEIAPEMAGENSLGLQEHAREMLEFISQDIEISHTTRESAQKALGKHEAFSRGSGGEHGVHRHKQGMTMLHMIQELCALRARVTKAWGDQQRGLDGNDIEQLVRFNEAIDQLIATSLASFTALKEQVTRMVETMLTASLDPVAIFEPDGKILFLNAAMAKMVSAPPRGVIGRSPRELKLDFATEFHAEIARAATTGRALREELHCHSRSGREYYYDCQLIPVFDGRNKVEAIVKTARDITVRKHTEYRAWRSANFDLLTGLPNRRLFIDRLEQTLKKAKRRDASFALLFIDLDRFKQANDHLGHKTGDSLLVQVAERIANHVRAMDTVARLGGDEFTLLINDTDRDGANKAAHGVLKCLEQVFEVDSHQIHISGSIGVTLFPHDGADVDILIHNADQAMYAAKELGGHQVKFYYPSMADKETEYSRLSRELDNALRQDQLEVYYQPMVDIRTRAICRAEALLRWNHPRKGLLTPSAFLDTTASNRMTDRIGAYVLEQAVTCSLRWRDLSDQAFPININESPASFVTRNLIDQWRSRLTDIALDESSITLELTPASLNNIRASGFNSLKSLGLADLRLGLSIDNFGIEQFSLLALQESRLDSVKIDRELIKETGEGGDADRIVEGIIAMAHAIEMQVVAVGVEKEEQLQFLARAGCDYAQGYLFSPPLRQNEFEALLARERLEKAS